MKNLAARVLTDAELTDVELFKLCDHANPVVKSLARHAYNALSELDSAQSRLEDARYWVAQAVTNVERYLDDGSTPLNSLGVLQAKGAALDVAVATIFTAEKSATEMLQLLAEAVGALG
jgi:hypothetical protein